MVALEQLIPGAKVRGIVPDDVVSVISGKPRGSAVDLTYRIESTGRVDNRLLFRTDESALELVERDREWAYDADGDLFRLVMEAQRIRLAHLFDPQLAVSVSQVEPLPHQIAAVYDVMLQRQPLRFLLADDPGAGKTVMTGLLIKELMLRGDLRRCLIVVPAALDQQWREELEDKFGLYFEVMGREQIESAVGSPFARHELVIGRIDLLKQEDNVERLRQLEDDWDLVVVDEAHKMSASYQPGSHEVKETARYKLGKTLGERTRHLLLLTATPHRGKQADFHLLLSLLDPDRFEGSARRGDGRVDVGDMIRRMMKEDLVDFEGRKLFPSRFATTVSYTLSDQERELYEAVTHYVREEMNRADEVAREGGEGRRRRTAIGFALTILQRRLASSPEAIFRSLVRRRERLEGTLTEQRAARGGRVGQNGWTHRLGRVADLDELETDLDERPEDEVDEVVDQASASRTLAELELEINNLRELEGMARQLWELEVDSKWRKLRELLEHEQEMREPDGQRRKLIIFTEHRDTLNYLVRQIGDLLDQPGAVAAIHGGVPRDERRDIQNRFNNDSEVVVLVATDAAGEGINLQRRAHLMINYDLPWNPNRLEQRFGRIHRFGQKKDCYCWNLVAADTREGDVYRTLLEKLGEAREALGGKVFDVLGQLFADTSLRDLLLRAVREGDDPARKAELDRVVADVAGLEQYRELLERYALDRSVIEAADLAKLREDRERAEINRLVPHFIASFFVEAFSRLGGVAQEREPGRYQIIQVPGEVRRRGHRVGNAPAIPERYTRICFEKGLIHCDGKPEAECVAPGHPLLDTTIKLTLERWGELLRQGAMLVDPRPGEDRARALFAVRSDVTDDRTLPDGGRPVVSSEIHFVEIDADGQARGGSVAPYLDYRALTEDERAIVAPLLDEPWLQEVDAEEAETYAVEHLV
ncbi:MAG: helicase-related protein, partial [Thermomicrobiales bacterium]